jgi:hypothetical protein
MCHVYSSLSRIKACAWKMFQIKNHNFSQDITAYFLENPMDLLAAYFRLFMYRYVIFMAKDKPTRSPSTKSVTEKPKYSKCRNRPINMPKAIDIIPIASMFSSLSPTFFTFFYVVCQRI